jgi:hypothetical protein
MNIGGNISGALFSDDHKYRYSLWRIWDRAKNPLLFIGLNPSTANEIKDDPTIIRLVDFAKRWGYGGLYAGNLFGIVSAVPTILLLPSSTEIPGGTNNTVIKEMLTLSERVLVGWGEWGQHLGERPAEVLKILGEPVYCLKVNKSGEPCHPLYLPGDSKLIPYTRKEAMNVG